MFRLWEVCHYKMVVAVRQILLNSTLPYSNRPSRASMYIVHARDSKQCKIILLRNINYKNYKNAAEMAS